MKAEEQILELLAEVLRKQDTMQAKQDQMDGRLDIITQTLQGHQQILRTLATEQRQLGQQLGDLHEAVESIAPGCNATRIGGSTDWKTPVTLYN